MEGPEREPATELPSGTVTFLMTDLEGSTRLWEERPIPMETALVAHDALLRDAVESNQGAVIDHAGDGMAAAFASAREAVAAALEFELGIVASQVPDVAALKPRVALHAAEARLRSDGRYVNLPLNRCSRLLAVGHGGQVLMSDTVASLVRGELPSGTELMSLGEHRLRDLATPVQVFQLAHSELRREFPSLRSLESLPGNLPLQLTSFIGREHEVVRTLDALQQSRVVTLTGVGGVGKTRLALQVAGDLMTAYRDGVWLCELAPVRDSNGVIDAVAGLFDVTRRAGETPTRALVEFLRGKQLLMVLDNCEHLLEPVADMVDALERSCPSLSVLATSREGLGIEGEWIVAVPSLRSPGLDADFDEIATSDAVQLFVIRARAAKSDFELTPENGRSVVQICRRLDGLPLAIQLAAARVPAMNPGELANRLERRFDFLAGGRRGAVERHQTLRATIDWSYDLLSAPARHVLDRLSVFSGGFTLESVERVCSGDPVGRDAVWELLAGLVAQSLVVAEDHGAETRYRLLETIRQYAEEHLDDAGETTTIRDRHAEHCVQLGAELSEDLVGPRFVEVAQRFAAEKENFVAAMAWAIDTDDVDLAFRLLRAYPDMPLQVGVTLSLPAEAVLALPGAAEHPDYSYALAVAATDAAFRGAARRAGELCEEALTAARAIDREAAVMTEIITDIAGTMVALAVGDWHTAALLSEHRTGLARTIGDDGLACTGLYAAAACHVMAGDLDAAEPLATEGLQIARRLGVQPFVTQARTALAGALVERDPIRAAALLRESFDAIAVLGNENTMTVTQGVLTAARVRDVPLTLQLAEPAVRHLHWRGDLPMLAGVLNVVAWSIAATNPEPSAVLQGAAGAVIPLDVEASAAPAGTAHRGNFVTDLRRETTRQLVDALGELRVRELRARGAELNRDQAVALALSELNRSPSAGISPR